MTQRSKKVIVVGDRILIKPIETNSKTKTGLYLPETVKSKEEVATGIVMDHGPGIPMPDASSVGNEPWKDSTGTVTYIPMQAKKGDLALFLKKASIEIKMDDEKYLIVPQAALLILQRDEKQVLNKNPENDQFLV